ncbi:DUF3618 domain-containing protein [Caenispirillum salinarum]|uniref:DUF3618 domain-containing protein n=1 Tax=Caenispirillum salinarum TaxID=859058 RepID=UPI00384E9008
MTQDHPDDVERRIAEDRQRIDGTIDALQDRLSPGQLLDQAMSYMKQGGGETAGNWGRAVKENPFPLLLTGVGLAWLMKTTTNPDGHAAYGNSYDPEKAEAAHTASMRLQQNAGETKEKFEERKIEAKAKALDMQRRAEEGAHDFKTRVEQRLSSLRHGAGARGAEAKGRGRDAAAQGAEQASVYAARAQSYFQEQPLVAAAAAVGVGALLGGLLPQTRAEDEAFGRTGEAARHRATETARDAGARAERVAGETAQAAARTADETARREAGDNTAGSRHS